MFLQKVDAGIYGVNCYILADDKNMIAAVIDPGGDAEKISAIIEENELILKYIILTHGHADHIAAVKELKYKYKSKIIIHAMDNELIKDSALNYSVQMGMHAVDFEADIFVHDNDKIEIGDIVLNVVHTPGHTKGSICLITDDIIFTGDTLFAGSMGRTDLHGGSDDQMQKSLRKLKNLEKDYIILPGHGPASNLSKEKLTNPYLLNS